jgi:hypothetical protein
MNLLKIAWRFTRLVLIAALLVVSVSLTGVAPIFVSREKFMDNQIRIEQVDKREDANTDNDQPD